jgi:hypothetical protein
MRSAAEGDREGRNVVSGSEGLVMAAMARAHLRLVTGKHPPCRGVLHSVMCAGMMCCERIVPGTIRPTCNRAQAYACRCRTPA